MMYPAKLKARLEGTDVAGTFFASFDSRGSLWLTVEAVEAVYGCSLSTT